MVTQVPPSENAASSVADQAGQERGVVPGIKNVSSVTKRHSTDRESNLGRDKFRACATYPLDPPIRLHAWNRAVLGERGRSAASTRGRRRNRRLNPLRTSRRSLERGTNPEEDPANHSPPELEDEDNEAAPFPCQRVSLTPLLDGDEDEAHEEPESRPHACTSEHPAKDGKDRSGSGTHCHEYRREVRSG